MIVDAVNGKERMGLTYRTGSAEVLGELLSGSNCRQGTGSAAIIGDRLDIDGVGAVVDDNGVLGTGTAQEGGDGGENAELHGGGWGFGERRGKRLVDLWFCFGLTK